MQAHRNGYRAAPHPEPVEGPADEADTEDAARLAFGGDDFADEADRPARLPGWLTLSIGFALLGLLAVAGCGVVAVLWQAWIWTGGF